MRLVKYRKMQKRWRCRSPCFVGGLLYGGRTMIIVVSYPMPHKFQPTKVEMCIQSKHDFRLRERHMFRLEMQTEGVSRC